MKIYPKAYFNEDVLNLDTVPAFGDTHLIGNQFKGIANVADTDVFIKLDDLNPRVGSSWEPDLNYEYSSISESIVSTVVRHFEPDPNFRCLDYIYQPMERKGKFTTGTMCRLMFESDYEIERVLALGRPLAHNVHLSVQDYADMVVDVQNERRFETLVTLMLSQDVPEDKARHFLVQQIGFDILFSNCDRLNNPSNFVMVYDMTKETASPINIDYGRCLQSSIFSKSSEERYVVDPEFYDEDLLTFQNFKDDSIVQSHLLEDKIEFLKSHNFKPFEFDKQEVIKALDDLKERMLTPVNGQPTPLPPKYTSLKIDMMKKRLDLPQYQFFFIDTSLDKKLEGLNEFETNNQFTR